ncbi:MAG: hypothetical protein ACRDPZ_07395 [Gaiellaceae bacterium]
MRLLVVIAVVCVAAARPASAATVDPKSLVLAQSDVPRGFRLDPAETGLRSNELEAKESLQTRVKFALWRRVTGYQARFRRGSAVVEARADVFRGADGARKLLEWVDLEARKSGTSGQQRAPMRIGAGGWIYWAGGLYHLVAWRHGRVFAGVAGAQIARARLVALARVQQRRIAAALR